MIAPITEHRLPGNFRDLLRVAYRLIAAVSDPISAMDADHAITYALRTGLQTPSAEVQDADVARTVARSFLEEAPLDDVVKGYQKIPTDEIFDDIRRYLAPQLLRIASERGVDPGEICDKQTRTLYKWVSGK